MPAKSKKQQRFMGMVHAAKKGEKPASAKVAKAAKGMTKKSTKDFASTKHKNLPEKVEETFEHKLHNILIEGILRESEESGSDSLLVHLPFRNINEIMAYFTWEGREAPSQGYPGSPGHIKITGASTREGKRIPANKISTRLHDIIMTAIMKHLNEADNYEEDDYNDDYHDDNYNDDHGNDHDNYHTQYDDYHGTTSRRDNYTD